MIPVPHVSLTEAATALAFSDPVVSSDIESAIAAGRWGTDRGDIVERIRTAVKAICRAGFAEQIGCWGKKTSVAPSSNEESTAPVGKLAQEDYLEWDRYIVGYDTLWQGGEEKDEFADAFRGFAGGTRIDDIKVGREGVETLKRTYQGAPRFTDSERRDWIRQCPVRNGDNAYRAYKKDPRYDGTKQEAFREEWRRTRGHPKRGRPKSSCGGNV